jgi:hypothetical protein
MQKPGFSCLFLFQLFSFFLCFFQLLFFCQLAVHGRQLEGFRCPKCGYRNRILSLLKQHKRACALRPVLSCPLCERHFIRSPSLFKDYFAGFFTVLLRIRIHLKPFSDPGCLLDLDPDKYGPVYFSKLHKASCPPERTSSS